MQVEYMKEITNNRIVSPNGALFHIFQILDNEEFPQLLAKVQKVFGFLGKVEAC